MREGKGQRQTDRQTDTDRQAEIERQRQTAIRKPPIIEKKNQEKRESVFLYSDKANIDEPGTI